MNIKIPEGGVFYGGQIAEGPAMPYKIGYEADLSDSMSNQVNYLLLSTEGRYIYSESPFAFKIKKDSIDIKNTGVIKTGIEGNCLRSAYLYAMRTFYPSDVKNIEEELFISPQFNTWIELIYNQNQKDVVSYAEKIREEGFPAGVLMIDDNWQEDYGVWKFHDRRFPDPKAMTDKLHSMGFKIMLWVCPFVSPDSAVFRYLNDRSCLVKNTDGSPYICSWWNGWSAVLDLSNPETVQWFRKQLDSLQKDIGIDGFKFDAGNPSDYPDSCIYYEKGCSGFRQAQKFSEFACQYPFSELRETCNLPQGAAAQRLKDKNHSWVDNGIDCLIPDSIAQSIMGYQFICPDMIGGGEYQNFTDNSDKLDPELIVRNAQASALLPMMQFSAAPWRILDEKHLGYVKAAAELHIKYADYIVDTVKKSLETREAVVRPVEYSFPHSGFENIKDEFMLGDKLLVCPVVEKGVRKRSVVLPEGIWTDAEGKTYLGGQKIEVAAPLKKLVYFILN